MIDGLIKLIQTIKTNGEIASLIAILILIMIVLLRQNIKVFQSYNKGFDDIVRLNAEKFNDIIEVLKKNGEKIENGNKKYIELLTNILENKINKGD